MDSLEIARQNAKRLGKHKVSLEKTKDIIITCLKNELINNKITKSKREQILDYMEHHVDMSISLYIYAQNRHREWEEEVKRLEGEKRKEEEVK
tara:strand:- start:427 stop:705 length:279 start_codon:yes stop_codon:yes gene_type:complete